MSLFGYCLIVQALFDKASTAGGVVTTVCFIMSFFDWLVQQPDTGTEAKTIASLVSPVAINRAVYRMGVAENTVGI